MSLKAVHVHDSKGGTVAVENAEASSSSKFHHCCGTQHHFHCSQRQLAQAQQAGLQALDLDCPLLLDLVSPPHSYSLCKVISSFCCLCRACQASCRAWLYSCNSPPGCAQSGWHLPAVCSWPLVSAHRASGHPIATADRTPWICTGLSA